nr:N-acetylglucosamine-6-phosphate deacetylase [Candidatus Baldrarchaeota archaeon]
MGKKLLAIKGGTVITPFKKLENGVVIIEGGKIKDIGKNNEVKVPSSSKVIKVEEKYIVPGFIDLHTHGGGGYDILADANYDAINKLSTFYALHGVTSFLATTATAPHDVLKNAMRTLREAIEKGTKGAQILGIHLEGPWISKKAPGAQPVQWIRPPLFEEFMELYKESGGNIKLVTIAPEEEGGLEFAKKLREMGIVVSIGHSMATFEQVVEAIKCGVTHAAHVFNAMGGLHHRKPGTVGAILSMDEITAEVIADCVHVHPAVIKILVKAKGADKICLITDSTPYAGMPDGEYAFAGIIKVTVKDSACRLPTGQLAGSVLTMDRAVKNMVEKIGVSLQDAIKMATYNPAKVICVDHVKGSLEPGKDADITILNKDLEVEMVIIQGTLA